MKKRLNARFLVLGVIALTTVILIVSFFLFSHSSRRRIEQNTESYLSENTKAIAAAFYTKLNDQLVMLESQVRYFNEIDLSNYNAMKDTILATKGIGAFKTIGVANSTGATINYNGKSSGNIMLTDYFQEAMNGIEAVSAVTYTDEDGDDVLVLAVPIMQNGSAVGVVYGTFTKDILDALIGATSFAENSSNFLLDSDGTVLARSYGNSSLPDKIENFNEIAELDLTSGTEKIIKFRINIRDMFAVVTPVGLHDWSLVTVLPETVISTFSTSLTSSFLKVVILSAISFLLLIGSSLLLLKQVRGVTAEKERMSAELNIATKIQADMMPYNFPERDDVSLYATMTPAKEIGGDFYDFFFKDDDHLYMVMADVAGKGIPAALFMVNAKSVIRNATMIGGTPSEILGRANNALCENNSSGLFVTVWLGVLTLSTGELQYANAGHEYPAVKHGSNEFKLIEGDNCPPLAAMEDLEFENDTIMLEPGDSVFLYTDGVPEAKNAAGERFGTGRMIELLNKYCSSGLTATLSDIKKQIDEFNGDKDPFDDVTMMGVKYFGKP